MMSEHERDELVSAYLDGEISAEERAVVEADAVLLARAEDLRAAAAVVGEAVRVPDGVRQAAIARALRAYDEVDGQLTAASRDEIATVRDRREVRARRLRIISAAAAVIVGLIAVPLLLADRDSGDADLAGGDVDNPVLAEDDASGGGATALDAAASTSFGTAATVDELVDRIASEGAESQVAGGFGSAPVADAGPTEAGVPPPSTVRSALDCSAEAAGAHDDLGDLLQEGTATVDDDLVLVRIYSSVEIPDDRWIVVTDADCSVLTARRV